MHLRPFFVDKNAPGNSNFEFNSLLFQLSVFR